MRESLIRGIARFASDADTQSMIENRPNFLVSFDLGGMRGSTSHGTLDSARKRAEALNRDVIGYSSHSVTLYQWRKRAVDGAPYLHAIGRWHFGELVGGSA